MLVYFHFEPNIYFLMTIKQINYDQELINEFSLISIKI